MNTETISLNLEPGERLAGVYLLQSALDAGGNPAIWLAEDEVLGKSVALHFLPPAVAADERALAEIRLEVKRTRPLIHPTILRVYDLVEGDGWAAIATDAFSGRRLSTLLEEHGRYEVRELDNWLDQLCVALEEAHRIKLTHRDLAAENIFVKPDGRLLLANFGIGRAIQDSLKRAGAIEPDSARFSSAAPQQLESGASSPTDDVYGLGALFYHLIIGEPVFAGGDVAAKIRGTVPPRLSDQRFEAEDRGEEIPPSWDNVIAACLNKNRDERPSSPAEIVSSIEAYVAPVNLAPSPLKLAVETPAAEVPADSKPALEPEQPLVKPEAAKEPGVAMEFSIPTLGESAAAPLPPVAETTATPEVSSVAPEVAAEVRVEGEKEPQPLSSSSSADETPAAQPVELHSVNPPPAEEAPKISTPPVKTEPVLKHPLYETDEDAFSSILPKRFRFPAAVAAAVVFVLFLVNGAFKSGKETPAPVRPIIASDTSENNELTTIKNSGRETSRAVVEETPSPAASAPIEVPPPAATAKAPVQPEMIVAAAPAAKTAAPAAPPASANSPAAPADKQIAEKSAALDKLKADLAAFEKQEQTRLKEKQAAETAAAEAQKAIDAKTQAAAAAKKEAQELIAARKQRDDELKAADLAAQAAQQLAAEKVKAADDAKKALADFEAKNRAKLATQDKVEAELQTLQRTLDSQRKTADESTRAAAAATTARQQQIAAIEQTEQELSAARAMAAKAAEEAQRKNAVNSERKKLDDEIAAMRALFEQKMKDIEDRRRQLEGGAATPAPTAAPSASVPTPEPPRPAALATPAPGLPLMASRVEPPVASLIPPAPAVPSVPAASGGSTNSLGLRFVPVGDVQFSTWLTRWKDFDAFARAVNLKSTAWRGPGFRQGPEHPVVNVTWNEAIAFCKWLTDKEHKEGALPANQFYRLPYDLEWSKAVGLATETGKTPEARDMGVPDVYPWGTDWPPPKGAGNYTGEETGSDVAIKGYDDGFAWTSPVGSFPANKLGIYDMGGNVWQWCMDSWNADSKARALRGASWYNGALKLSLLASCRIHATPDSSTDNYGFRIVRATEASGAKPARR